jgi:hypothetical protein
LPRLRRLRGARLRRLRRTWLQRLRRLQRLRLQRMRHRLGLVGSLRRLRRWLRIVLAMDGLGVGLRLLAGNDERPVLFGKACRLFCDCVDKASRPGSRFSPARGSFFALLPAGIRKLEA